MKWINGAERMFDNWESPDCRVIARDMKTKNIIPLGCIYHILIKNKHEKLNNKSETPVDWSDIEWLDESEDVETNSAYVIHCTKNNGYLTNYDDFTSRIIYARIFPDIIIAELHMSKYIKIYSQTNRKELTEFLKVIPIEIKMLKK